MISQPNHPSQPTRFSKLHIFTGVLVTLVLALCSFQLILMQDNTELRSLNEQLDEAATKEPAIEKKELSDAEKLEVLQQKEKEYFVAEILPQYPDLFDATEESIISVHSFGLNSVENRGTAYFVETTDTASNYYYLLTDTLQTELLEVMNIADSSNHTCQLQNVVPVNTRTSFNGLSEVSGYLVIEGELCSGTYYGTSVSVFSIDTGEKVPLRSDLELFEVRVRSSVEELFTQIPAVTEWGNATGSLQGVYGFNEPVLVIEYLQDTGAAHTIQNKRALTFFDLQTGQLLDIKRFE